MANAGLNDGRTAGGQSPGACGSQDVIRAVQQRIEAAKAVVVLNTPKLRSNRWARYEMDCARELGKRIVVLQPEGAFAQPIPPGLHGAAFHVSSWRSDVLARAVRGARPYAGRVFDLRQPDERRALAAIVASLDAVGSVNVTGASTATLAALAEHLAEWGVGLRWSEWGASGALGPALLGAGAAGLLAAFMGADSKTVGTAAVLGAAIGATVPYARVFRARLVGPPSLQVLTLEAA
jgi:hypothetical protein